MPLLRRSLAVFCSAAAALVMAQSQPPVAERALDIYTPVALDEQRLAGIFAVRNRANIEGYLEQIDTDALLEPFRSHSATASTRSQTAGLFLIAASNSYEYSDDSQLRTVMDRVASQIEKAQDPDGYLGLQAKANRWSQADLLTETSSLLGLIDYWHVTGEDSAADALERAANLLTKEFSGRSHLPEGASALAAPMVELYLMTSNGQYLQLCRSLATLHRDETDSNPLVSALTGYGLVELYRVTGSDADLRAAKSIWLKLSDSGYFVAGIPDIGNRVDSCLTLAWFQFTLDLFRLTGEARYAAQIEPLVYNAMAAAQDMQTGGIDPAAPLVGAKKFERGLDVCTAAEAVAISELGASMWGRYGPGVAILAYNPGRGSIRVRRRATVAVYTESNYPQTGNVIVHVEPSHPMRFPVQLLVPSWSHHFTVKIGETDMLGKPGQFLTLNREWKKGDTLQISIDMRTTVVPDPRDASHIALRRGPQLLTVVDSGSADARDVSKATVEPATLREITNAATGLPDPMAVIHYSVRGEVEGKSIELILAPLASSRRSDLWFQNARGL